MTIQEIEKLIIEGHSLKTIAVAYSEIAHLKIKKIRAEVERNRLFFDSIAKIYGIVKGYAISKGVTLQKPKKRLHILITSNYKFYGNINLSLINYFLGSTHELRDTDTIVIGRGAVDYFKAINILPNYKQVLLQKDIPNSEELKNLSSNVSEYNQVLVFYSKLKSLLVQRATFTDLTATSFYLQQKTSSAYLQQKTSSAYVRKGEKNSAFTAKQEGTFTAQQESSAFIFEPELPKLLSFFENQIMALLLEQTFLESELSRTASRFISMDQAQTEADKFIKIYAVMKGYTQRSIENMKILDNYATLTAARKMGGA